MTRCSAWLTLVMVLAMLSSFPVAFTYVVTTLLFSLIGTARPTEVACVGAVGAMILVAVHWQFNRRILAGHADHGARQHRSVSVILLRVRVLLIRSVWPKLATWLAHHIGRYWPEPIAS